MRSYRLLGPGTPSLLPLSCPRSPSSGFERSLRFGSSSSAGHYPRLGAATIVANEGNFVQKPLGLGHLRFRTDYASAANRRG